MGSQITWNLARAPSDFSSPKLQASRSTVNHLSHPPYQCIWTLGSVWHWEPAVIHSCSYFCIITGHSYIKCYFYVPHTHTDIYIYIYIYTHTAFLCSREEKTEHMKGYETTCISTIKRSPLLLYSRTCMLCSVAEKLRVAEDIPRITLCSITGEVYFIMQAAKVQPVNFQHSPPPPPRTGLNLFQLKGSLCWLQSHRLKTVRILMNCCVVAANEPQESLPVCEGSLEVRCILSLWWRWWWRISQNAIGDYLKQYRHHFQHCLHLLLHDWILHFVE